MNLLKSAEQRNDTEDGGTRRSQPTSHAVMFNLKDLHLSLLRRIVAERGISIHELDRRNLRPLARLDLVEIRDGIITATPQGRHRAAEQPSLTTPMRDLRLSASQEDLLRAVVRQKGVSAAEADRRTVRALKTRGLVEEVGGELVATPSGRKRIEAPTRDEPPRRRGKPRRRSPRAEAVERAVDQLERVIPPDSEVLIGSIMAAALDVTAGFRVYARRLRANEFRSRAEREVG